MTEVYESVEEENTESKKVSAKHNKKTSKTEKVEKVDLICPNAKCNARNSVESTVCILCKTSLEDAKTIVIADDWGNLLNYISISGVLFLLLGLSFAKYSLIVLAYCLIVAVIMWPVLLRTAFKKLGRKPPGFIMRTAIALILMIGAMVITPSQAQMKAQDNKDAKKAMVEAKVKANEVAAKKKASEQEEKQRQIAEAEEAAKVAAEKKAEEEANKPEATTTPKIQPEERALVNQPFKYWLKASKEERMWTAAALTYAVFKDKTQDKRLLAIAGEQLFDCLNAMKSETLTETPVSEVATLCAMGLGWANKD